MQYHSFKKALVLMISIFLVGMTINPVVGEIFTLYDDNEINNVEKKGISGSYYTSSKDFDYQDSITLSNENKQNVNEENYEILIEEAETEIDVLDIFYEEDIIINMEGEARIDLTIDVPQSALCDLYRQMYGIIDNIDINKIISIPSEPIAIQKNEETYFSLDKDSYFKSFSDEQWFSLGLNCEPYDSYMIPYTDENSFKVTSSANALLNVIDFTNDIWTIRFGTYNDNVEGGSFEYLMSLAGYSKLLLDSIPGQQIFKRSWTTRIHLPEDAELINGDSISGKHWLIDLLYGSYMSTNIIVESNGTILVEELFVITEYEKINPTHFGDYKTFNIEYILPYSSETFNKNLLDKTSRSSRGVNVDWNDEEIIPPTSLSFEFGTSYFDGELVVNFTSTCSGKITSKRAWIEVEAYAEATLTISFVKEWSDGISKDILPDISTWVSIPAGPVPILVQLTFGIEVGIDYGVEARCTATAWAFASAKIKLGGIYDWWDGWEKIWESDFNYYIDPPSLSEFAENVNITVWVKPWIGFPVSARLYGTFGPYIEPKIYFKISYCIRINLISGYWDDFWTLQLGFSVDVGVVVGIPYIWDESWGFEILDLPIWKWDSDSYVAGEIPPALDKEAPLSNITLFAPPMLNIFYKNEWQIWAGKTVTFTISAVDYGKLPSGVKHTYYYAGNQNNTYPGYTSQYIWDPSWGIVNRTTVADGTPPGYYSYYINCFSIDNISNPDTNVEYYRVKDEIRVDYKPPSSQIIYSTPVYAFETKITITSDDSDSDYNDFPGTGSKITYRIGDGNEENWTDWIVGEWDENVEFYLSKTGTIYIEYFAGDGVWNNESIKSENFNVQLPTWLDYMPYDKFSTDDESEIDWYNSSLHPTVLKYFNLSLDNNYRFVYGTIKSYHPSDNHDVIFKLHDDTLNTWIPIETLNKTAGDYNYTAFGIVIPSGINADKMYVLSTCGESEADLDIEGGLILHYDRPPNTPNNPTPANRVIGISDTQDLTLHWYGGDPDRRDNITYSVYFGVNPNPTLKATIGPYSWDVAQISYQINSSELQPTTTYYWQIVANDSYEILYSEGPIWHFTTGLPPSNVYVDDNASLSWYNETQFDNIFDAIKTVREGGNVFVYNGTYPSFTNFKTINIIGNGSSSVIIDGNGGNYGISIGNLAGYVNISGFTVKNCSKGIQIYSDNTNVFDNKINDTNIGIFVNADNCNISDNTITYADECGIELYSSKNNEIYDNIIKYIQINPFSYGIADYSGLYNLIISNTVQYIGRYGIYIEDTFDDNIIYNIVTYCNNAGIWVSWDSDYNKLKLNFISSCNEIGIGVASEFNLLENNTINGNGISDKGIYIGGNNNYITYNRVFNNSYGIFINLYLENINIVKNSAYDNTYGIYLYRVNKNINVTYNNLHNPDHPAGNFQVYGIFLNSSKNINVSNNSAQSNDYGYYFYYSNDNKIRDNKAYQTSKYAIYLKGTSANKIIKNELKWSSTGGIMADSYCTYNTLYNNWINGSVGAKGIHLKNAYVNNITYNYLNATLFGIKIESGGDNNIQYNNIIGYYTYQFPPTGIHIETVGEYDWGYCNNISYNNIYKNTIGIYLSGWLWDNEIYNNFLGSNDDDLNSYDDYAIYFYNVTKSNSIISNTIVGEKQSHGLMLDESSNLYIADNNFTDTGIIIKGDNERFWKNFIISNNEANWDPIRYYKNTGSLTVPSDTAQIILAKCNNIKIKNIPLNSRVDIPIQIGYSSSITISGCNLVNDPYNRNDFGIYMLKSSYCNIEDNIISRPSYDCIFMDSCDFNKISLNDIINTISGCLHDCSGIKLINSNSNKIYNNSNIIDHNFAGIYLYQSDNNTIINNYNIDNNINGIYINNSIINRVLHNNLTNNSIGINVENCNFLNISRNYIFGHPDTLGIKLYVSRWNTVKYNHVANNGGTYGGIKVENSYPFAPNIIFYNDFIGNKIPQAWDNDMTGSTIWDNGYSVPYNPLTDGGNHWSDWISPDNNSGPLQNNTPPDGIVDYPYLIIPGACADNYPFVNPKVKIYGASKPYKAGAIEDITHDWDVGGATPWFSQDQNSFYGNSAAQSGPIIDNEFSYIRTHVDGPGTLIFYWSVSSQEQSDWLSFSIDGIEQDKISGDIPWTEMIFAFSDQGYHELMWTYEKDEFDTWGQDCGWIDYVQWIAYTNQPTDPTPFNQEFDVSNNPTLIWSCGDPDIGDTVNYEIYFGTEPNPPLAAVIGPYQWDEYVISWEPGELYYGIPYYWKIIAIDNHNNSAEGQIWSFTTEEKLSHGALWNLDEASGTNIYDLTPYHNDGTITGATWTTGYYNSGLYFDGNDFVAIPHSSSIDITVPFSVSAWINPTGSDSYNAIVDKHQYLSGNSYGFTFYLNDGKLRFTIYSGINGDKNVFGTTDLRNQGWHHVKAEWDGNYIRVYLNGNIEGETEWIYPPASSINQLGIGRRLDGWGGYLDFKGTIDEIHITRNDPPDIPSDPVPINGQSDVSVLSSLNWICDDFNYEDIITYDIYLNANDPTPDILVSEGQTSTEYTPLLGLEYNTTYYWRIYAKDNRGKITIGPIWEFTTEIGIENHPPEIPNSPSPVNGATGQLLDIDLSWTCIDPDGDPVTYDIYFEAFDPIPGILVSENQTGSTFDPGNLDINTYYYWQITAKDDHGHVSYGPVWYFRTRGNNPPNIPSSPYPSDGEFGVDIEIVISWIGGDPDGDQVKYDIYFGDTNPPPLIISNQTETSYYPGLLENCTIYYWKIVAWDSYNDFSTGPIWYFKTNCPPYMPNNPDPLNHAIDVDTDYNLSWSGGDPDPGDIVIYDIYFGTSSPPPLIVSGHPTNVYNPGTMNSYTQYFWKIIAFDTYGLYAIGPEWDFTTYNQQPYTPSDPNPYDGEIDVDIDHDLSWSGGDPDPDDTVIYDIYFGTSSPPPLLVSGHPTTIFDLDTMEYNQQYYWKIIAWDDHLASSIGPIWHFITEEEPIMIPDLDCSGNLDWTDVTPGDTVTGSITVENIGDPDSLLDWEIESYPDWGIWTFDPESGNDLLAGDSINVDVEVVAPNQEETTFTGEVVLVNSEDSDDTCTIDVTLATPVSLKISIYSIIQRILEKISNLFPIFEKMLIK